MRNVAMRKLRSSNGASLMVALLFFVVCAAIGSIVLTAATAASGRINGIKNYNQKLYSLRSAASLFEEDLMAGKFVIKEDGTYYDSDDNGNSIFFTTTLPGSRDLLALEVYNDMKDGIMASNHSCYFDISSSVSESLNVKAVAEMLSNYDLELKIFAADAAAGETPNGYLTIKYTAKINQEILDSSGDTEITWADPKISMGGNFKW